MSEQTRQQREQWDAWFEWVAQAEAELRPGLWERTILMVEAEMTRLLAIEDATKRVAAKQARTVTA